MVLGQKASKQGDGSWTLSDGTTLTADVAYQTVGGSPNTEFLQRLGITDARGAIKVGPASCARLHSLLAT